MEIVNNKTTNNDKENENLCDMKKTSLECDEKTNIQKKRNQEAVFHLLSSVGGQPEEGENFVKHDIRFKDLASLNENDLIALGIPDAKTRYDMLETFQHLPNQAVFLASIIESEEGKKFNNKFLENGNSHLDALYLSMSAANFKAKMIPPADSIINDKYFAGKLLLEALNQLKENTQDMEKRLDLLEETFFPKSQMSRNKKIISKTLAFTLLGAGAYYLYKIWIRR